MLVTGFWSVVVAACVVVPVVIGLLIQQKWREGAARQEEVKRLLALAAGEAATAEYAATAPSSYHCAVCYCPTTTRCARCKAIRYCSGKCQIVHWRQGHREECHPPPITYQIIDSRSDDGCNAAEQDEYLICSERAEIEERQLQKPSETVTNEHVLRNYSCPPEIPSRNSDDTKVEFLAEGKRSKGSASESSGSFSGFSTSCSGSESSDDVSVSESIISINTEKSDEHISHNAASDIENTARGNNLDRTKPPSPKFASLVNHVHSFTSSSELNQIKPGSGKMEDHHESTPSPSMMHEDATAKTCSSSSIFWERALNTDRSEDDSDVECCLPNSSGAGNSNTLNPDSVLKFSFKLPGSTISPSEAHVESLKTNVALPSTSGYNIPIDATSSSEKISKTAADVRDSLDGVRSNHKEVSIGSFVSCSSSVRPSSDSGGSSSITSAVHVINLPPSSSQRQNHIVDATDKRSVSSESSVPGIHSSSAGGPTVVCVKSKTVDGIHVNSTISSQGASYLPNSKNGLKTSMWKVVDQLKGSKQKHYQGLFPYDMFVKLYNWNKVELLPCGLNNCGNSCYANAVLQCLAFTPPLTAYFLQGLHSKACANKEWCFTCEFESLILKAKDRNSPLSPTGILSQLQNIGSNLGHGREEDAHEFLRYAVDTMQSVCLKEAGAKPGSSEEETTLIGLTFGGYLRSKIKCMKCQGKSERRERMMDLTVEIEGDIGTLEEALRKFTGTEILDGENKYHCSRCKSYEKAKKKLTVLEAPNVLTIALKRFQTGKFGKLNKSIRFPEILDLAPYMSGRSDTSPIYRLCGVVVHLDIMNAAFSGHYVCYVKNIQNKWFKIDDSTVTTVELERVLTKGAYMLLYSRCSPRAPRSVRNKIVTPDPRIRTMSSRNSGKNITSKSRTSTSAPRFVQIPSPVSSDGSTSYGSFYTNFHQLQKIMEVDSSSDNCSLFSSNSDGGTESTRDSSSTDDISDYIFGDSEHGWNSPWRSSSDTDTSSSSSSPLYSSHSSVADSDRYVSTHYANVGYERNANLDENKRSVPFSSSDTTGHRKLGTSSSSFRETDSEKLGRVNSTNVVKSGGVTFRKSARTG